MIGNGQGERVSIENAKHASIHTGNPYFLFLLFIEAVANVFRVHEARDRVGAVVPEQVRVLQPKAIDFF